MPIPEIENPPVVTPPGWDDRFEPFPSGPMPRTEQPCGCYIRLGDYESILCGGHLAELNTRPNAIEDNREHEHDGYCLKAGGACSPEAQGWSEGGADRG